MEKNRPCRAPSKGRDPKNEAGGKLGNKLRRRHHNRQRRQDRMLADVAGKTATVGFTVK